MERAVYFDAWYPRQHCDHPSLPTRWLPMVEDLVDYRATSLAWTALVGGSISLSFLEQEAWGDKDTRSRNYGFMNDAEYIAEWQPVTDLFEECVSRDIHGPAPDLAQYRTLVLPACSSLTRYQADLVKAFPDSGRRVLATGEVSVDVPPDARASLLEHPAFKHVALVRPGNLGGEPQGGRMDVAFGDGLDDAGTLTLALRDIPLYSIVLLER